MNYLLNLKDDTKKQAEKNARDRGLSLAAYLNEIIDSRVFFNPGKIDRKKQQSLQKTFDKIIEDMLYQDSITSPCCNSGITFGLCDRCGEHI